MLLHLILIAVPLVLLALFLFAVSYEERRSRRLLLSGARYRFDQKVERTTFIFRHVDWGAFLNDLTTSGAERLLHDVAHTTLKAVRVIERELTSLVRALRARREPTALPPAPDAEEPSRIATATAYLKKTVRRSRKVPVQNTSEE